jgi:hypothetical protein
LTHAVAVDVLRAAVTGYRDLVEHNFATFGWTLGLNSVLPVCVEGAVEMPEDDVNGEHSSLIYQLRPDAAAGKGAVTSIHLVLLTDPGTGSHARASASALDRRRIPFYTPVQHNTWLPTGQSWAATNLAYQWLAADLHAVGWLDHALRFDN